MAEPGHEIVSGTIGTGKSYWVLYKIIKSLELGIPCCYIDPKGDTYRNLLSLLSSTPQGRELWDARASKILLVNPVSPSDYILGFNAIEPMGEFLYAKPDTTALLSNSVVSHIRRQSGFEMSEANRMQNIMSAAIGTLAEGGGGNLTLAELPMLFVLNEGKNYKPFNPFVERLLGNVSHHGSRSFWENQWTVWPPHIRREWVQSTEGRIFQYLFDERLMMTVCTTHNASLNFRKIVDEGYWLFINAPYPLLSETITTMMGNIVITKLFYACMQRQVGGVSYRVILDEARFFNTGPLDVLLETSRAYNLWLTLVVQSLDQMCRMSSGSIDQRLRETALNNVRYLSVFHSVADSETLARLMFPVTGQVVTRQRDSGDFEYLPIQAEVNEHERRFGTLKPRQVILYDKFDLREPRVWKTPNVETGDFDQSKVDMFEAAHMHLTGKPAAEIRREVRERQDKVRDLLRLVETEGEREVPEAAFGGNL